MSLIFVLRLGPPPFGSSWVKRYCTFVKEQKILHMVTFDHRSGGKIVSGSAAHKKKIRLCSVFYFPLQRSFCHVFSFLNNQPYFDVFLFQGETESITLKSCVRKTTDVLDRRFCLDLDITDRYIVTYYVLKHTVIKSCLY